jgi:deoxyribose-phosphate aldolase
MTKTSPRELKSEDIARLVDVSTVRTPHGEADIRQLVTYAKEYRFISVHALPCWVSLLSELLAADADIYVGAPVGFPSGAHKTMTKLTEAEQLLADGVQEMDLMMNVGMLRSGRLNYVEDEIKAVVQIAGDVEVKVILEVHCLSDDEIKRACELCIKAGAAFVKTSTGWMPTGATLETVSLISNFVGNAIKIKAAGGIRDLDTLAKMVALGVARFGINVQASMDLISACAQLPGGVLRV